jgi:hypothetical protein
MGAALGASVLLASAGVAQACTTLPNTLSNGATADANQVMADFNGILSCPSFSGTVTAPGVSVSTGTAQQPTSAVFMQGSDGHWVSFDPSAGPLNWNPVTQAGDAAFVFTAGSPGTGGLSIVPWNANAGGIRIDSAGNVGIRTGNPRTTLDVIGGMQSATIFMDDASGSGGTQLYIQNWHNEFVFNASSNFSFTSGIMTLTTAGNMTVAGRYLTASDARLKSDIKPIESALAKLSAIRGVTFYWKDPKRSRAEQVGVLAQDVEKVFPQSVVTDERTGYKSVDYASLVSPLIEAVKELKALNQSEQQEIARLKQVNEAEATKAVYQQAEIDSLRAEVARTLRASLLTSDAEQDQRP